MNILITGGNGFLGKKVIKNLVAIGHHVKVLVIPEEDCTELAAHGKNITIIRGDLTQKETITGICKGIDTVIHLAALLNNSNRHLNMLINYEATQNIADEAEAAGVQRFIF